MGLYGMKTLKMGSSSDELMRDRIVALNAMAGVFITRQTHRHIHRGDAGKRSNWTQRQREEQCFTRS